MKRVFVYILLLTPLIGCNKDDEGESSYSTSTTEKTETRKVDKPTITVSTATTTTSDFTVVFKVTSKEEATVTLHYGTTSSCTKSSSCRLYQNGNTIRYYKASHTGFSGGSKVYFYGEATNSGGTSKTSVDYRIIKR